MLRFVKKRRGCRPRTQIAHIPRSIRLRARE